MVKPGYKQTEVGVIPEHWRISSLATAFQRLETGVSVNSDDSLSSEYHILKTSAVHHGVVDTAETKPVIPRDYPRLKCPLVKGSIIISRMNTPALVGECGFAKDTKAGTYLPDRLWQIQNLNTGSFDFVWLNYLLNSKQYRDAVRATATGTSNSMKNISKERLLDIKIPHPPISEQADIAVALLEVDELINLIEKQISKKKAIKQGTMQELLTGKKRLPGFSGEWESITLGTVGSFYNGGTPSKKREDWWTGNIPWISSSDLSESTITSVKISHFISQDAVEHSATRICPKNAVLIVSRVGVGKVAISPCELCTSQDFTTVVSSRHNPYYLAYVLVPIMEGLAIQAQGTSIKGVTIEDIQKIVIPTPTVDEQNKIVSILANMDSEIKTMEKKLAKYRQIKQGMMQQLLTGKIRLV